MGAATLLADSLAPQRHRQRGARRLHEDSDEDRDAGDSGGNASGRRDIGVGVVTDRSLFSLGYGQRGAFAKAGTATVTGASPFLGGSRINLDDAAAKLGVKRGPAALVGTRATAAKAPKAPKSGSVGLGLGAYASSSSDDDDSDGMSDPKEVAGFSESADLASAALQASGAAQGEAESEGDEGHEEEGSESEEDEDGMEASQTTGLLDELWR